MRRVFAATVRAEGGPLGDEGRLSSRYSFRDMDGDRWLEIVARLNFERLDFHGFLGTQVHKWDGKRFRPFNTVRRIGRVRASSVWRSSSRGLPKRIAKVHAARVGPRAAADGVLNSAWVSAPGRRGVGQWVKIPFLAPRRLAGLAIAAGSEATLTSLIGRSGKAGARKARAHPAKLVRIEVAPKQTFDVALVDDGRLAFFPLAGSPQVSYVKLTILDERRNSLGKVVQRLRIPSGDRTAGSIAEIVPIFHETRFLDSSHERRGGDDFRPSHLGDGLATTAWAEGRNDDGLGSWVQMILPLPQRVSTLIFVNGCARPGESTKDNNRVKKAYVQSSNGDHQEITLADTPKPQKVKIRPVRTRSLLLTIREIYRGRRGRTTCLAEWRVK